MDAKIIRELHRVGYNFVGDIVTHRQSLKNYKEFMKEFKNFNQQMDTPANKIPLMTLYSLTITKII